MSASAHTHVSFYRQACKQGGIYVDGQLVVWAYTNNIKGWRTKDTAPAPAELAEIPADPDKRAGWRARLTLAGPGVDVRVKSYYPEWAEWVVTYLCGDSEINLVINKDERRLKLLGELGVGSVGFGGRGLPLLID